MAIRFFMILGVAAGLTAAGFGHAAGEPVAATAPAAANGRVPEPATASQRWLHDHWPELYASAASEYGWHEFRDGRWQPLPAALPSRVAVLVHGLDEPGKLWMNLAPALVAGGWTVCDFRYPNDQPVRASAAFFGEALGDLRRNGAAEVILVAHSMGGLVSREWLTSPELDYAGKLRAGTAPRALHLIMIGTPNHGSSLARARFAVEIRDQWLRLVRGDAHLLGGLVDGTGEAAADLLPDSVFLRELNARPHPAGVGMTIIAGIASPISRDELDRALAERATAPPADAKTSTAEIRSCLEGLVDGIGDGAVPLASARLDGVPDIVTVAGTHLSMIRNVTAGSDRVPPSVPLVLDRVRKLWPPAPAK